MPAQEHLYFLQFFGDYWLLGEEAWKGKFPSKFQGNVGEVIDIQVIILSVNYSF